MDCMHGTGRVGEKEAEKATIPGPPMISFISPIRIDEQQPPPPCVVSQIHWF